MSSVLILGGTAWLGQEIARQAVLAGHDVTCVARGESGDAPDGVRFIRADRSLPGALQHVNGEWDAVIELAYEPGLVAVALDAFADRAGHWSFVSTISVYASHDVAGADESAPLVDPVDTEDYGQAKVAAELLTRERVGDRLLITRPGLIAGPGDPSDRFGYWPGRFARGGRVLAPAMSGHVQVIDVADLARWLLDAHQWNLIGTVDAVGPSIPMAAFFARLRAATAHGADIVEAPHPWLREQGVNYWAGPRSMPLWLPEADAALTQRSGVRLRELGGSIRPIDETIARVIEDETERGLWRTRRSGLTPREEEELLDLLRDRV